MCYILTHHHTTNSVVYKHLIITDKDDNNVLGSRMVTVWYTND